MEGAAVAILAVYAAAVTGAVAVGVVCWRRRRGTPAAYSMLVVMTGIIWWSLTEMIAHAANSPTVTRAGFALFPIALPILVLGFHLTVRYLIDPRYVPSRRVIAILGGNLLLVVLAVLLPHTRELVVGTFDFQPGGGWWHPGPLFWIEVVVALALLGWSGALELRAARHTSATHRAQLLTNLSGALVPSVGMLISTTIIIRNGNAWPLDALDWTALGWLFTCLLDLWSLDTQGLMATVPIARGLILEELGSAVYVFDTRDGMSDVNAAGRRLLADAGVEADDLLGASRVDLLALLGARPGSETGELVLSATRNPVREVELRDTPLHSGKRPIGSAVVLRDITGVNQSRRELALANTRLRHQLQTIEELRSELAEQAVRDSLTGLHNRRYLDERLALAIEDAQATDESVSLVVLDIDLFKAVNDQHGHMVGDQVLVAVARALVQRARHAETITRFGGEEFVLVLPGVGFDAAMERARELQTAVDHTLVPTEVGPLRVTVSGGVATAPLHATDPESLIRVADEALYRAKSWGRNRVTGAGLSRSSADLG